MSCIQNVAKKSRASPTVMILTQTVKYVKWGFSYFYLNSTRDFLADFSCSGARFVVQFWHEIFTDDIPDQQYPEPVLEFWTLWIDDIVYILDSGYRVSKMFTIFWVQNVYDILD